MSPSRPPSGRARRLVAAALYFSGCLAILRRFWSGNTGAFILRYHSIGGAALRRQLVVSARHFASHVRHLRRCYSVVPLEDLVALVEAGHPFPPGTVAITFDDGYRDNLDIALPILRRHRCPATVFVVVESARTGAPPWPQQLFGLLRSANGPEVRVAWQGAASGRRLEGCFDLRTPEARDATYRAIKAVAAALADEERAALLERIAQATGQDGRLPPDTGPAMLDCEQVRELARHGVTIGSHTMTHPRVSALAPECAARELLDSRVALESMLERDVPLFAYPFGKSTDFNAETRHAVMKAGYRAACTTIEGIAGSAADPFALPRVKAHDEPVWMFAARLLAAGSGSRLLAWVVREP